MSTVHALRKGSPLVTASDAVRVMLVIERNESGKPRRLVARPASRSDPVIHWTRPMHHRTDSVAREVLWVADDLQPREVLRVEARPRQHPMFQWDTFELDEHNPSVVSGPAEMDVANGHRQVWTYAVRLRSPRLAIPLGLEPLVIVVVEDV